MDPNLISHKENDDFGADDDKIDLDDIKGKIFIGGLSWQTSEANLRYYFEKFGELSDVALMIDKRTGKPRGFGFIKMKDPAAADIVMSTEHTIDGRLVDVKRALPRDKAPGPTRSEACKIFVGGLAPEITEKEFGDYFSKFGIVKDAVVMVDRNTGSSRGFGFVTFEAEETVEQVMKIQHEIMGKYVEIKRAEPRDSRSTVGGYDNGAQGGMYGGMGGYGGRMASGGGRGGPMNNNMGGPRYGQPGGNTGMMGANGYGGANMAVAGGYGGYMGAPGAMRPGAPAGPAQSYNRYPAGYGGAAAAYGRGAGGYGGMSTPTAGYGYPNPAAISPQGMGGYYGGAAMPAPAAGYGGYGSTTAPPQGPVGAQPAAYGGAAQYSPTGGRPGAFPAEGADFNGAPVDGRAGQPQGMKDGYDSSAIAAGYANAAAMQMRAQQQQPQFSYGGAAMAPAGYGGAAYGVYGAAVAAPPQGAAAARLPAGAGIQEPAQQYGNDQQSNYGAYRGQGATQGRVDRSYRPY